jgi:hypothetical protein
MRHPAVFLALSLFAAAATAACGGSDNPSTGGGGATTGTTSSSSTGGAPASDCTPGQTQDLACGKCGQETRTCGADGTWGSYGACAGETGVCQAGDTESMPCTWSAMVSRTCSETCTWGDYGACTVPTGWRAMAPSTPAGVSGRPAPFAVWTGKAMLVWGGVTKPSDWGFYDPATNTWAKGAAPPPLNISPLLQAPKTGQVAWTGSQLVVVLGDGSGAIYDGATAAWTSFAGADFPLVKRLGFAAVTWMPATGEVLVYGGFDTTCPCTLGEAAAFNVTTKAWRKVAAEPLAVRSGAQAIWDGSQVLLYGGDGVNGPELSAATYDPVADAWTTLGQPPIATALDLVVQPLTGPGGPLAMLWGGAIASGTFQGYPAKDGALWDETAKGWTYVMPIPNEGPFEGPRFPASWSTGAQLFLWGGQRYANGFTDSAKGLSYDLATATWTDMLPGGPTPRHDAVAVWTGTEAVVWGGQTDTQTLDDGMIYRP